MAARAIVVYESKYGNTKLVAEEIGEGMKEAGVEASVREVKGVDVKNVSEYDAILLGSPNHVGGPTGGIKKFVDGLGTLSLQGKLFGAFDTYLGRDAGKAAGKIEKRLTEKVPGARLFSPALSIRVAGMKGPVADGELPRCREYGEKAARELGA